MGCGSGGYKPISYFYGGNFRFLVAFTTKSHEFEVINNNCQVPMVMMMMMSRHRAQSPQMCQLYLMASLHIKVAAHRGYATKSGRLMNWNRVLTCYAACLRVKWHQLSVYTLIQRPELIPEMLDVPFPVPVSVGPSWEKSRSSSLAH